MGIVHAIMIGDVVGEPGLEVLERRLPCIVKEYSADFVTVNGENAAGGFGLTEAFLERIFGAGADVVTSGNHIWEKREFWPVLEASPRVLRPMNYPAGSAGRGSVTIEKTCRSGEGESSTETVSWLVVNLQGREFMTAIDCPFRAFDSFEAGLGDPVAELHTLFGPHGELSGAFRKMPVILVDFHAESTREKESLGYYLDGRASVVAGTHTHIQTADERILPKGTAYITDLGMTGVLDGIIGMDAKICLNRARNQVLYRMEVAGAESAASGIQGIAVEIDSKSRRALSVKRFTAR